MGSGIACGPTLSYLCSSPARGCDRGRGWQAVVALSLYAADLWELWHIAIEDRFCSVCSGASLLPFVPHHAEKPVPVTSCLFCHCSVVFILPAPHTKDFRHVAFVKTSAPLTGDIVDDGWEGDKANEQADVRAARTRGTEKRTRSFWNACFLCTHWPFSVLSLPVLQSVFWG